MLVNRLYALPIIDGRRCSLFNVIDDFNREGLAIDADISLPTERVIQSLDRIIEWCGKPKRIRSDNGLEYISHKLANWAKKNNIELYSSNPVILSKTLILNVLIGQLDMTG